MNPITITQLYELFVPKLGKEASEGLATYLETKPKMELENNIKHLVTKEDLAKFEGGLIKLEGGITKVEGGLISRIEQSKAEIIKWMFLFWIGQMVSTCGIIFLFLKK